MNAAVRSATLRDQMLSAVEDELQYIVTRLDSAPATKMARMVRFHFGWQGDAPGAGGKRVRPLLALLSCQAAGGDWSTAIPAAAAVELIHNFSLIHDDIEDRSRTRRGRPTLWVEWSLAQALNVGDAILILSQSATHRLRQTGVSKQVTLAVLQELDEACLRLTVGQHLDLAFEQEEAVGVPDYLEMIAGKTSALLEAAVGIGARLGGANEAQIAAYRRFGHHLGMAFQIEDDILGIWGEPAKTGKPAGDDLRARKKSLPIVHGLGASPSFGQRWQAAGDTEAQIEAMRQALEQAGSKDYAHKLAEDHTAQALTNLGQATPAGTAAVELEQLAHDLVGRES